MTAFKRTDLCRGLGEAIKTLRTAAQMSQHRLAKKPGLNPIVIKAMEEGEYRLTLPESKRRVAHAACRRAIGTAIQTFREAEGMEPATLAELADFRPGQLDAIEEGSYLDLTVWDLERLAAGMRVRPSQIMASGETITDRKARKPPAS